MIVGWMRWGSDNSSNISAMTFPVGWPAFRPATKELHIFSQLLLSAALLSYVPAWSPVDAFQEGLAESRFCLSNAASVSLFSKSEICGVLPAIFGQNLIIASRMESFVHLARSILLPLKWVMVVPLTSFATKMMSSSLSLIRS